MEEGTNLYKPDNGSGNEPVVPRPRAGGTVSWTASEYIEHVHGAAWYFLLTLLTAAIAAMAFFIAGGDYFAAGAIVVVGVVVGIAASRKPRVVNYELTSTGIQADGKLYPYKAYKSFSLIKEGPISSLNLLPLKRLVPPLTVYLPAADEDKIAGVLGEHLPYEERQPDAIDRLSRRLRF